MKQSNRMKLNRKLFFWYLIPFWLICWFNQPLHSQDPHFTMIYNAPLYLNPANTGNFDGSWRISGNYRNQWSSLPTPFSTFSAAYDKNFSFAGQNLAAGLYAVYDEAGSPGITYTKIYGSVNYTAQIHSQQFRFGLQGGLVSAGPGNGHTSPSQWNPATGQFDPDIITGLPQLENINYMDVNAGIIWKSAFGKISPEIGLALGHINQPNQSFYGGENKLKINTTFFMGIKTELTDQIYILPTVYYSGNSTSYETLIGSLAGYYLQGNSRVKIIYGGAFIRNPFGGNIDAVAFQLGANIGRIDIAANYDVNVSELNARGSFEISFIYKGLSTVFNTYSIPCERF